MQSVICAGHQSPWTWSVKWNERWQQSPAGPSLGRGLSQTFSLRRSHFDRWGYAVFRDTNTAVSWTILCTKSDVRECVFVCLCLCVCVLVQLHNRAEMWSKYVTFQGCTAVLTGLPLHMPNRKHSRVCRAYRFSGTGFHHPNLVSVSLYFYIDSSSSWSFPSLTSTTVCHWRFISCESNFLQCLCVSHTLQSLWRTIQFLVLTHMSSLLLNPPHSFHPFILPAEVVPNQSGFLGILPCRKQAGAAGLELPVIAWADIPSWIRAD